jgi:hypothetical protein
LNLDTSVNQSTPRTHTHIEHLLENISDNELHEYEKLVPSYYAQPDLPKLTYDPNQTYTFVVFDTETTCTGKNAELCQLSAIHESVFKVHSTDRKCEYWSFTSEQTICTKYQWNQKIIERKPTSGNCLS